MTRVVIDTNVVIDYLRVGINSFAKLVELQKENKAELYLSSVSIVELFAGKSSLKDSKKLLQLTEFLSIIPLTTELAKFAGELKRDNHLSITVADLIIAASALTLDAKLATRNKRHFKGIPKLQFLSLR